jgi:uncharacterized protein YegL
MSKQEQTRRIYQIAVVVGLMGVTGLIAGAAEQMAAPIPIVEAPASKMRPRIEVAFVLDTTGSMSGLIEGAKQKIWSVANQMADGQPKPEIRIGLIGYRDRGDEYVTKRFDLTDDIDSIYAKLFALTADGGGDTPESVNRALHEAITKFQWSDSQNVYKVVFLVGDAPPHMDYQDDVQYPEVTRLATAKGIVVNTIQCGNMGGTTAIWQEIAKAGSGAFAAIAQGGGMVAIATPMDDALASLNRDLAATAIAYGSDEDKRELARKLEGAAAAPSSVVAERLSYLKKSGGRLNSGRSDLADAVKQGLVKVGELSGKLLSAEMQAMEPAEREAFVQQKIEEREAIQDRIDALTKDRDVHVRAETERLRKSGKADGFDGKVLETIRSQAAVAGIQYE